MGRTPVAHTRLVNTRTRAILRTNISTRDGARDARSYRRGVAVVAVTAGHT